MHDLDFEKLIPLDSMSNTHDFYQKPSFFFPFTTFPLAFLTLLDLL